jgi:hypothetical protein
VSHKYRNRVLRIAGVLLKMKTARGPCVDSPLVERLSRVTRPALGMTAWGSPQALRKHLTCTSLKPVPPKRPTSSLKVGPSCCSGAEEISGLQKFWHREAHTFVSWSCSPWKAGLETRSSTPGPSHRGTGSRRLARVSKHRHPQPTHRGSRARASPEPTTSGAHLHLFLTDIFTRPQTGGDPRALSNNVPQVRAIHAGHTGHAVP